MNVDTDKLYFTFQTIATYKDGVWSQLTTPMNEDGGKTQSMKSYLDGGDLVSVNIIIVVI